MSKLKLVVLTVIAALTVGTSALAAAPSASAVPAPQPPRKGKIAKPLPLLRIQFTTVLIT
jgi:hypothetical protein